jgi:predicted enzyme related to lactoylglutathione lyase
MDHTIVHFEIPADQPERAARFYRELFGWDIERWDGSAEEVEGMADYRPENFEYWMVKTVPTDEQGMPTRPGVNGGLMRRVVPGQSPVNYINVESVDEFVAKAEQLGAKVLMRRMPVPGMGWFAQLTDTEGNLFALWQTDPSAGMATRAAGKGAADAGR